MPSYKPCLVFCCPLGRARRPTPTVLLYRRAIGDQLAQEQDLKRKITMESDDDGDDKDGVDSGSDIEAGGGEREHAKITVVTCSYAAVDTLRNLSHGASLPIEHAAVLALERDILAGPKQDGSVSDAVAGLKFMRQAVDRKRQEAQRGTSAWRSVCACLRCRF